MSTQQPRTSAGNEPKAREASTCSVSSKSDCFGLLKFQDLTFNPDDTSGQEVKILETWGLYANMHQHSDEMCRMRTAGALPNFPTWGKDPKRNLFYFFQKYTFINALPSTKCQHLLLWNTLQRTEHCSNAHATVFHVLFCVCRCLSHLPVMLLDTTESTSELGWTTYPDTGVSTCSSSLSSFPCVGAEAACQTYLHRVNALTGHSSNVTARGQEVITIQLSCVTPFGFFLVLVVTGLGRSHISGRIKSREGTGSG